MTTAAPARASASAIPAPSPGAPPVTRALRPVRSYTLIGHLFLDALPWSPRRPAIAERRAIGRDRSMCLIAWPRDLTTVKRYRDDWSEKSWQLSRRPGIPQATAAVTLGRHTAGAGVTVRRDDGMAVTEVAERNQTRVARRQVDKFAERRDQLAAAALQTLAELGYARTSLRDIAQNSEFSHGVLHYYFSDKIELITYCVRQYKAECVKRYDSIVATASRGRPAQARVRRGHGRHAGRGGHAAPALVRPAQPEPVRRCLPGRRRRDRPEPGTDDLADRQQVRRAERGTPARCAPPARPTPSTTGSSSMRCSATWPATPVRPRHWSRR